MMKFDIFFKKRVQFISFHKDNNLYIIPHAALDKPLL